MSILTNVPGTLLGPLTTTWTIPQSCTVNFQLCSTCSSLFQGQKCVTELDQRGSPLQDNYKCWPPAARDVDTPQHPLVGWGFYSPGVACPSAYTSACTAIYDEQPEWDNQFLLRPGETAVGCCPEGFSCTNSNGNKCVATATTTMDVPTAKCSGTDMFGSKLATLTPDIVTSANSGNSELVPVERTMTLFAPLFQLNHQSTDLETATSRPTSTLLPTQSPSVDESLGGDDNGQGLSAVAKLSIGLGVGALILLLAGLALGLVLRKRKQRKAGPVGSMGALDNRDSNKMAYIKEPWQQSFSSGGSGRSELYGNAGTLGRHELADTQKPVELPGWEMTK
ncbi:hypothetical protein ACJZ2D_000624 [Fusarium nematophilum]